MSFLIFAYRKQQIIALKSSLNYKIMQLNQKLMDLATYSASIAEGKVTGQSLIDTPASLFERTIAFAQYSGQMGQATGIQNTKMYFAMNPNAMAQIQPEYRQQYQDTIYQGFFKQGVEKACEVEKAVLNAEEKKINSELATYQTQLKQLEAEEEQVNKGIDDGAKKSAPQYVA